MMEAFYSDCDQLISEEFADEIGEEAFEDMDSYLSSYPFPWVFITEKEKQRKKKHREMKIRKSF